MEELTPEQILNWRKALCGMLGPYALVMPDEQVKAIHKRMQENLNGATPTETAPIAKPSAVIVDRKPFNGLNL